MKNLSELENIVDGIYERSDRELFDLYRRIAAFAILQDLARQQEDPEPS